MSVPASRQAPLRATSVGSDYPLWHPWTQMKVFLEYHRQVPEFVSGSGCWLTTSTGQKVLDACSSLWNVSVGHGRPEVSRAIAEQLERVAFVNLIEARNPVPVQLAERLVQIAPPGLTRVFLTNTGTAAVEGALFLARQYWARRGRPEKQVIIGLERAYHGTSLMTIAAGGDVQARATCGSLPRGFAHVPPPDCYRCPYGMAYPECGLACAGAVEREILERGPQNVAAVIAEPVMGAAGVVVPPAEYFRTVREICDRYDVLLILDEVATGAGRTGEWFAATRFGIIPDISTLGKGITGGYLPLGAILAAERIFEAFSDRDPSVVFGYGSTTDGHPVCCAAALATLDIIERDGLVSRAAELGERMLKRATGFKRYRYVGDVRGCGLMMAIDLVTDPVTRAGVNEEDCYFLHARLLHRGVLTSFCESSLCLLPPLCISDEEMDHMLDLVEEGIATLGI